MRLQSEPRQVVLRATIDGIAPPIWRLIRVPEQFSLHQLHRTLQFVFGWLDYHLYSFRVGGRDIEGPNPEATGTTAAEVSLAQLRLKSGARLQYLYDFGDDWEHELEVIGFLPMPSGGEMDWSPRLLDGARAGPPEDAGGPHGYERVLEAWRDPANPDHEMYLAWVGQGFDPERFDLRTLDKALGLASAWGAV